MAKQTASKPTEENTSSRLSRKTEFKETILMRNPDSGRVDVLSSINPKSLTPDYTTVEPSQKNKPAFYEMREGIYVAELIQKIKKARIDADPKAESMEYYLVPFDKAAEVGQHLQKIHTDPDNLDALAARKKYRTSADNISKILYPITDEVIADLKSLGLNVKDMFEQGKLRYLSYGLESTTLYPVEIKSGKNTVVTGDYSLHLCRDENDVIRVELKSPLRTPEYNLDPELNAELSMEERDRLYQGYPLGRPIRHNGEMCLGTLNPSTKRMVYVPVKDIVVPSYIHNARISSRTETALIQGGTAKLENCCYSSVKDNSFKCEAYYNPLTREVETKNQVFEKPYIPLHIANQLKSEELAQFSAGKLVLRGSNIRKKDGITTYNRDIVFDLKANSAVYVSRQLAWEIMQRQNLAENSPSQPEAPAIKRDRTVASSL